MHIEDLVGVDCARRDLRPRTRRGFVEKLASVVVVVVVVVVVLAPQGTASSPPLLPSSASTSTSTSGTRPSCRGRT